MNKLIAGLVIGLSLAVTAHADGDPQAGKKMAGVCAGCHGQNGAEPVQPAYPKLSGLGENYLYKQLKLIQSGDRQVMEMTGILDGMNDQDLQDLAAYFDQQQMPIGKADPELVDRGRKLYRGGDLSKDLAACAGCHNPQGQGNEPAAFPRLSGQTPGYVEAQLKAYRDGERDAGGNAQIMMDIASRLSDEDIKALAAYVSGLH
ncbi:cytochrome c553 [Tamilnaduibacter salinus]|uniref:Cytochrome c4 n=1 Tax=Tamilnaduibacter salinus TaxID=1484056 RepID=A0A2A2I2L3_9GAMM|nr:c-type cytochrome [Tamilnaduibacter salinus]PAV25658.1 cytochrome c4 [Tamilnaduibacter salinus]PVY76371.1 cytochrome c553 [Tamilnaduibacter salinus]